MSPRYAAVDCGTNSIRLLVADIDRDGRLVEHDRRLELVRLGQGVDATRRFHPDALARTFAACERFAEVIDTFGCDRVRFVATSAARDVSNRDEFFAGVERRLGVVPEVIPGDEEARLSFVGALSGVPDVTDPVLVVDIGGGSTELVVGSGGEVRSAVSLDMGSVRLRERFLRDDPATGDQIEAARGFVRGLLDASGPDLAGVRTVIGVAGTVTSLSAIDQGLAEYDRDKVHGSRMSRGRIGELAARLLGLTGAEIEATTCLAQKRAEVIAGGALICDEIAGRTGAQSMIVSESDILDGMVLAMGDADA